MAQNYVRPLTLTQSGPEGVYAQGTLHMATKPTADDTVTIGGVVYTFKAAATLTGHVAIGALVTNSQTNLRAAIGGDAHNAVNPFVSAAAFGGNNMVVTARIAGPAGNLVSLAASFAAGAPDQWDAAFVGTTTSGVMAPGTGVPATSRFVGQIDFEDEDEIERTPYALGLAFQHRGFENIVSRGAKLTVVEHPINFESLPMWLSWAFNGGIIPVVASSIATYTHTPSKVAYPGNPSRTLFRRMTNGVTPLDDKWTYGVLEQLNIKWQQRKNATIGASGFARGREAGTWVDAAAPSSITQLPAALIKVYVDDTWGALGGTQITGQIVGGDFAYMTGWKPDETADGRSSLDMPFAIFDPEARTFTFKTRAYVRDSGFAIAERAKAEAASYRAIRIAFTDPTTTYSLVLNFIAKHTKGSQVQKMVDVNGQEAVDLEFVQSTDAPSTPSTANVFSATLVTPTFTDD